MENHKPECPSVFDDTNIPCICAEIKRAEKRLLDKIYFVLRNTPDELLIADNGNQAFNVKWWIIELIDEIGSKP